MNNQNSVRVEVVAGLPSPEPGIAVAICVFEDSPRASIAVGSEVELVGGILSSGEFEGEDGTSLLVRSAETGGVRQTLLVGCGSHADFDARELSRAAGMAARDARSNNTRHLYFILPSLLDDSQEARAVTEGALMGLYDGDGYRNGDEPKTVLDHLSIVASNASENLKAEIGRGQIIAESVNWTRTLSDEPGASLPPTKFMSRVAEMAAEVGLKVESLDAEQIRARGMGGLWGVGKGSDEPPALIVVRYEPEGATDDELWAFVGKGITFDTGGISLKHGLDMFEMKADMAGGAAVFGALRAIAQLKPKRRIVGIVPAAENMPSARSIKPGDIVKTLAGYTIEVVDTDAEGRLVLSDGIAYAKELGAARIVDLATLTGSIIVALGDHRAGLFSNDDPWAKRVESAALRAGEPAWRMPVGEDYKKRVESDIADFKNFGGRPDATGAAFLLSKFAGDTPWVHLDIAGTSWYDDALPYAPKGSSGAGVRTLVELAMSDSLSDNL